MANSSPTHHRLVGLAVLLVGLALTGTSAWVTLDAERAADRQRFERRVDEVLSTLRTRMFDHEQLLRAGVGLWAAQPQVDRRQWQAFAERLQLQESYPGVQGLGYVVHLQPEDVAAHEAAIRSEGHPGYQLRPAGQRDAYTAIVYLEPFSGRNLRAFGYDMFAEPVRRAAMETTRDTGQPALSGKVTLVQENERSPQAGTLLYLAVYRPGAPTQTVAQRREALQGYVYSPFRMGDLMQAVLADMAEDLAIELFDGPGTDPQALLFSRRAELGASIPHWQPRHATHETIMLAQHAWSLRLSSLPAFELAAGPGRAWVIGLGGGLASALAAALVLALLGTRQRALALAETMSQVHRDDEARIRAVMDHTADAIFTADARGRICSVNRAMATVFGHPGDSLVGQPARVLMPERVREQVDAFYARPDPPEHLRAEWPGQHRDGHEITVRVAMNRTEIGGETRFVWLISDISEQRRAERAARQAQAQREAIIRHSPLCIIATDPHGLITSINPAGERLLGYRRDELEGKASPVLIHDPAEVAERAQEMGIAAGFEVFVAAAREGRIEEREWTYIRRDGSRVPVSLSVAAIRGADDEITGFLGIALDITERQRSRQALETLALHDSLTGLPNRQLMSDRAGRGIERARRHGRHFAVLLLDLDRFKQINDTLGHAVGDEVLKAVAMALRACVRATDTPARLGGDEFVVLLDDLAHPDQALQVADKILARLGQGVTAGGRHLAVTPSIGIALWPEHGASLEALLEAADAAMYRAKQAGRNAYRLAEPISP
jgi:diguanylate cyclase (GGDEF)-like protein/PAS domain S-box-containing protein